MLGKASIIGYLSVFLEAAKELLCFNFLVAGRSPKLVYSVSVWQRLCGRTGAWEFQFDTKALLVLGHLLGHFISRVYAELPSTSGAQQNVTQLAWFRKHLILVVDGIYLDTKSTSTKNSPIVLPVRHQKYYSKLGGTYRWLCEMTAWMSLAQTLCLEISYKM